MRLNLSATCSKVGRIQFNSRRFTLNLRKPRADLWLEHDWSMGTNYTSETLDGILRQSFFKAAGENRSVKPLHLGIESAQANLLLKRRPEASSELVRQDAGVSRKHVAKYPRFTVRKQDVSDTWLTWQII